MNSARNANRSTRGRGHGGGRVRGGFHDRIDGRQLLHPLPTAQQVLLGASVSIVLKIDQPTGHEVQGIVAELLTRGNHPRGIKVRLQDGRVGRVQRMASTEAATAGSEGLGSVGRTWGSGEGNGQRNKGGKVSGLPIDRFTSRKYGDYRLGEPDEPTSAGLNLSDYVVVKAKGKKGMKKFGSDGDDSKDIEETFGNSSIVTPAVSTCPVCGEFDGDEVAVAHHVNTHFD